MTTLSYAKEVKANKEHHCNFCGDKIRVGDSYLKSTHKYDGGIYDWKTHKYCSDLAHKLKMYDDADEGVTDEIFQETISQKYFDIMLSFFGNEELKKFSDAIQHFRYVNFSYKLKYVRHVLAKQEKEQS